MSKTEKQQLRGIFKDYKRLTKQHVTILQSYSLKITLDGGNHYKIQRLDGTGGCVILARSPSDYRAGRNTIQYIIKLIEG